MPNGMRAGWYSLGGEELEYYWDGSRWTGNGREHQPVPTPVAPVASDPLVAPPLFFQPGAPDPVFDS